MNIIQLIGVLIAALGSISAAVSAYFSSKSSKITLQLYQNERKEKLNQELNRIIELGIQYPYVENKTFTSKWNEMKLANDEKYLRYDMYCNLLFNYLHHVFEYYKGDKSKIESYLDVKSWIRFHKENWYNPVDENENIDGYDEEFRKFINSYLN